ncbi:MAG: SGNH/GDSL hydrolase family protein [bacterium]|nr:SGNH/GDSL hydrolase family protein [bacterium]
MKSGWMIPPLALALFAALLASCASPSPQKEEAKKEPGLEDLAFARVVHDSRLPKVLLIGDSISIGYTYPVREYLKGKANVYRIPENGGPTTRGLEKFDEWVSCECWDVIHFNWGLHDLKIMEDGTHQVEPDEYRDNLIRLVEKLKASKAVLIWASTTPVPEGKLSPPREPGEEMLYNDIAERIMHDNGIIIDDLHAAVAPRLAEFQVPSNVHFTREGYYFLGRQVADSIERVLKYYDFSKDRPESPAH